MIAELPPHTLLAVRNQTRVYHGPRAEAADRLRQIFVKRLQASWWCERIGFVKAKDSPAVLATYVYVCVCVCIMPVAHSANVRQRVHISLA
jgi:hypothetical protein